MIGVSLPFNWILSQKTPEGDIFSLLAKLRSWGVESIELRTVRPHYTPESVMEVMDLLWDNGFFVTVHGNFKSYETAVEEVFAPLKKCLANLRQRTLNITVHPISENLDKALISLSDYILDNEYPVTISLENNRLLPNKEQGDSTDLVCEAVKNIARDNIGICFDFGHHSYYVQKNRPDEPTLLPSKDFRRRIIHTHIHAKKDLRTHYPLGKHELPLELYLNSFSDNYVGVYNIELDFPRFSEEYSPTEALEASVLYLKKKLPCNMQVRDRTRKEFDNAFLTAVSKATFCEKGTAFSLIHSTSYLFGTNKYFWAMDIAFRHGYSLAETPSRAGKILKELKLLIITHSHADHFEINTIQQLAKNETRFLIPDFLVDKLLEAGIPTEKIIVARAGQTLEIGPLTIYPFESRHYRTSNGKGVREYGYHIKAQDSPDMIFPGDIRRFDLENVHDADILFAHLWLGDDSATEHEWRSYLIPWAQYMLNFLPKKIFITHLYENGRADDKMWKAEHALEAKKALLSINSDVEVIIADWGEGFAL